VAHVESTDAAGHAVIFKEFITKMLRQLPAVCL
jgi:hypothetical protein